MLVFLSTYVAVYAGLNLYVYSFFRRAGWRSGRAAIAFWAVAALMIFAPVAARMLDSANVLRVAQGVSLAGGAWMLLVLWTIPAGAIADAWNASLWLLGFFIPPLRRWRIPYRRFLLVVLSGCVVLTAWGLREASDIRLKAVRLQSSRLPPGSGPVKILQLSDLHLGLHVREAKLFRVLNIIRKARPDILVVTGDLLDSAAPHVQKLVSQLSYIQPPGGKFAVIGNHELYAGLPESIRLLEEAGFVVLRGQRAAVKAQGAVLMVAGVDYRQHAGVSDATFDDESRALPAKAHDYFTLLLKHEPAVDPKSAGRFDLQLSGHTHNGQVFPCGLLIRKLYPRMQGYFQVSQESLLYVSPGIGTWGPPIRILARPEVTLFLLEPEGK
jgi:uncharacterized protein